MIVGNTPTGQASSIYTKLSSNIAPTGAIQSRLKSSYDADMELIISQVGEKKPSAEKHKGRVAGREKPESVPEEQQKKQEELHEKLIIDKLIRDEQAVVAHEQAHKAVAGQYAGPITYDYVTGPDGKKYIVSGEVPINAPQGRTPEDTIQIMERVKRAALAPGDPSAQDVAVAAQAAQAQQMARNEINKASRTGSVDDYVASFPMKGKITRISDFNPYAQPAVSDEDNEEPADVNNKEKTGVLESLKKVRRAQLREASRDMTHRTISIVDQNTEVNRQNNLISFEKFKKMLQGQNNYSGRINRILDIVA